MSIEENYPPSKLMLILISFIIICKSKVKIFNIYDLPTLCILFSTVKMFMIFLREWECMSTLQYLFYVSL